jgi:uncharacterized protein
MARPTCCRRVEAVPEGRFFKPRGVPMSALEVIELAVDEFEAMRLVDLLGLYQERAAERMSVSRPTIGRILESARGKVVRALAEGHAIEITGGNVREGAQRQFVCISCKHEWAVPFGIKRPEKCPACGEASLRRLHGTQDAADKPRKCGGGRSGNGCQRRMRRGQGSRE